MDIDEEIINGVETPLGQHQRWLRQAPDLFAKYDTLLSGVSDAREILTQIALLSARANNASVKRQVLVRAQRALRALSNRGSSNGR